jgi:hypothetical protein
MRATTLWFNCGVAPKVALCDIKGYAGVFSGLGVRQPPA